MRLGNKRPCGFKANALVCTPNQDYLHFWNPSVKILPAKYLLILTASSPRSSSTAQIRLRPARRKSKANVAVGHGAGYVIVHAPSPLGWSHQSTLLVGTDQVAIHPPRS